MKIGIIGSTLARKLSANGHEVRVANSNGPEAVKHFADAIWAIAADARDAVAGVI